MSVTVRNAMVCWIEIEYYSIVYFECERMCFPHVVYQLVNIHVLPPGQSYGY